VIANLKFVDTVNGLKGQTAVTDERTAAALANDPEAEAVIAVATLVPDDPIPGAEGLDPESIKITRGGENTTTVSRYGVRKFQLLDVAILRCL
jgi:hypothetical protein